MLLENRQGSSGHSANRQQKHSEPGPAHTVATEEHKALWKSQQSRGEGEGGHQKHSTAVIEICISGNTGGRQFKEDSNSMESTEKRGDTTQKTNQRNQAACNWFLLPFCDAKICTEIKFFQGRKKKNEKHFYTCTG